MLACTFQFLLFFPIYCIPCYVYFMTDVVKCGALFYIGLITIAKKNKQNMRSLAWTYSLTLMVGCTIQHCITWLLRKNIQPFKARTQYLTYKKPGPFPLSLWCLSYVLFMLPGQKNVWANRKMGPKKYFRKLNGPKKLQNKWAAMYKKAGQKCFWPVISPPTTWALTGCISIKWYFLSCHVSFLRGGAMTCDKKPKS